MEIKEKIDNSVVIRITGRLDLNSAESTQQEIFNAISDETHLELDLAELEYIASAGLRVLLLTQNKVKEQNGELKITHVTEDVLEVFKMTGFSDILAIEY